LADAPAAVLDNALTAVSTATSAAPVVIYDEAARDQAQDLHALEQQLRQAIKNEEFELYFQPIIDLGANRPLGAEALIRWHSPTRGFVPPGKFIAVAEASGLIDPIGLWVLRQACREVARWDPSLRVAINLGARQFLDRNLTWHVAEAIDAAGIRPDQLEIELTESVAMVDCQHTHATFSTLRDMGLHIAIDDFGTGHANMSTLRKLPFTTLKIDREFVTDVHRQPGSLAICDALITLGHGLGLDVVAEGTEKAEEVAILNRRGCNLFQGYYFARPVPASALPATYDNLWLREAG
jgi:EAL domain-containing protein (putative c-di-GMP-specific phosphodiesterase class I)